MCLLHLRGDISIERTMMILIRSYLVTITCVMLSLCISDSHGHSDVTCVPLQIDLCQKLHLYNDTVLPNILGHKNQQYSQDVLYSYKVALNIEFSSELLPFLCSLYVPPCQDGIIQLPCRDWCYRIQDQCSFVMKDLGFRWAENFDCSLLPLGTENTNSHCLQSIDLEQFGMKNDQKVENSPPFDSPLGTITEYDFSNDDVTSQQPSFLRRRYDVIDLGDPLYFQGWADVQGLGAANDYCRVIGKKKRMFLSCAMAGSTGQDHTYVSRMGMNLGYNNTWFMRDLDGDGKDDYCRCIGNSPETKISCMKAGDLGFYGGPLESGDEYSFDVPASNNCHDKPLNPYHDLEQFGMKNDQKLENSPPFDSPLGTITEYDFSNDDVTSQQPSFLRRRYDVIDLGDPLYFQGWADVQGLGAANDYCRVIGKKKMRFLSCAMAGSTGQDHTYVSRMGMDLGYNNTWFMRDLDGDGKDDYCRCIGYSPETKISCMKAGNLGFYGGPLESGDEYSFDVPASNNCHDKPLNPYHGV